jgi:UDP-3-O-[3-hydroxymyristoyl] glucosamine N-acyltransferase
MSLAGNQEYGGKPARPLREEMKMQAQIRRLPKLIARVKVLEEKLGKLETM